MPSPWRAAIVLAPLLAMGCSPAQPRTTHFAVGGMVCASCEEAICLKVQKLPGVHECRADHAAAAAEVRHDPAQASAAAIAAAIAELGYRAEPQP